MMTFYEAEFNLRLLSMKVPEWAVDRMESLTFRAFRDWELAEELEHEDVIEGCRQFLSNRFSAWNDFDWNRLPVFSDRLNGESAADWCDRMYFESGFLNSRVNRRKIIC